MKLNTGLYDGIGFFGMYLESAIPKMLFKHANENEGHYMVEGCQFRPLNHLNPVKTEIARKIKFPEKNFAEDSDYCDRLMESKLIKTEYVFDQIFYHYMFDRNITETQKVIQ
jgi:hypothetical protein